MERHTTRRSFDQLIFCSPGDTKEWKTTVERGLVISLAKVQRLWSAKAFHWDHLAITSMFTEALPYHSTVKNKGERFEIYMQAFRVIDKETFLQEAKVLSVLSHGQGERGRLGLRACHVRHILRGWELLLCRTLHQRRLLAVLGDKESSSREEGCIWL